MYELNKNEIQDVDGGCTEVDTRGLYIVPDPTNPQYPDICPIHGY